MDNRATKRYAVALFSFTRDAGELERVRADMHALRELTTTSREFARFLKHPLIPGSRRQEVLAELFRHELHTISLTFLQLLEEKDRLGLLADIGEHFEHLYDDFQGILNVTVRSAHALSASQVDAIRDRLRATFDKDVVVQTETKPKLLGGLMVQAGDHIYDTSAATMLESFKRKLIHA